MSDWRSQVSSVEWRYVKDSTQMDIRYWLEARTIDCQEWSRFVSIDMDCAGEGRGEEQAREIVEAHNARLAERDKAWMKCSPG